MRRLYEHKFELPKGSKVYVPTPETIEYGYGVIDSILSRWRPRRFYHHLSAGGHVAAMRRHLDDTLFFRTDIKSFFDTVTRNKIARSLQRLDFRPKTALEIARNSTVEKEVGSRRFSLPFGFPQSPLLATVSLDQSCLGGVLHDLSGPVRVSMYMDDIIISARDSEALRLAVDRLNEAAKQSNFQFNPAKTFGPASSIIAFNVQLSHRSMALTEQRLRDFLQQPNLDNEQVRNGILNYVRTINEDQYVLLSTEMDKLPMVATS